jgi:hypothetical protein
MPAKEIGRDTREFKMGKGSRDLKLSTDGTIVLRSSGQLTATN